MSDKQQYCSGCRNDFYNHAHLIAAAPEMKEVLTHAILAIESLPIDALGEAGTNEDSWPLRDELLHRMRAAIAKAEGREP